MSNRGEIRTNAYEGRHLFFHWWIENQTIDSNRTRIGWQLKGEGGNQYTWYMAGNFKVVIDGATVYQSSTRIKLHGNTMVANGYYDMVHQADGSRYFSVSIEAGIYYYAVNSRGTGNWEIDRIPRATQPTVNRTTLAFGENLVINCPRASNQFIHAIQAGVEGKIKPTTIAQNVATVHTWNIPRSWGRYLTHTTDRLKIYALTYLGGQYIGTKEVGPITVTATDDMAPVVAIELTDANNLYQTYGGFVKGKSKIKAKVTEVLYEQAIVSSRILKLNGVTYQNNEQTSEIITSISQRIEAKVVDSRGMVGTKLVTPVVYDWYEPKITMVKANRCQANGTLDESGTYIKLEYACAIAPVNNKNQKILSYSYKKQNQGQPATQTIPMDTYSKTGSVIFPASGESSWEVTITLRDAFNTSQVVINVGTAFVLLDFHHSGKGIGVGKVAELQNTLDLSPDWHLKYKNAVMSDFVIEQGTKNNWLYRKWHSGIMEMSTQVIKTINVTSNWGSLFTSGPVEALNLTFPIAFISVPTIITSLTKNSYAGFLMASGGGEMASQTKTGTFEIVRGTSATGSVYTVNYHVVGRWKN